MSRLIIGQITIKKERAISSTKWYYLLQPANANPPDKTNYGNPPPTIAQTGYSGWSETEPSYTVGDDRKLYEMVLTVYTDGTFEYTTPSVSSSYEASKAAYAEIVQAQNTIAEFEELGLKQGYIWDNMTYVAAHNNIPVYPVGSYIASGIVVEGQRSITRTNSNTYGLNTWISTGGINLRYNAIDLMKLTTSNLEFYYPSTSSQQKKAISLGTNNAINSLAFYGFNSDNKTMELTNSGLFFYNPNDGTTAYATLNINGLKLVKGGIEAGVPNTNNFVYISSTDFVGLIEPFYRLTLDTEIEDGKTYYEYDEENDTYTAILSPVIENISSYYEYCIPLQGTIAIDNFIKTNWRQITGTNFAVDSNGNLYASNADISGIINAESGSIGGFEINNTQLYSNGHDSPDSNNNGIYIGSDKLAFGPTLTTYFENTGSGKIGPWYFDDGNIYINIDEYRTIKIGTNGLVLTDYDTVTNSNFETNGIEFNFGLQNDEYISVQILDKILIKDNKLTINADTITLNNKDLNAQLSSIDQNIADNNQRINNAFTYINNYEFYIATTSNNTSGYIQLKRKSNNNASSIKITDSIIELSINQNNITTYRGNLMHTTFGEFENLRMRVGTTGSLTWIARLNGHLSLKVVN